MCGIVGKVGSKESISVELDYLKHRGPDSDGQESLDIFGKHVLLGHTRLSILDLSPAGQQPMQSHDKRWWLTYNGEIYNHKELRKQLTTRFRGNSDTETLMELISAQGIEDTLPQLNGMFAFAALDTREGKLYLVRDPFGIKPLYYSKNPTGFAFSSEVGGLRNNNRNTDELDKDALQLFLTLRYTPSPQTLWSGIHRLQPGHQLCLDIKTGETETLRYIKPVKGRFVGTIDDATEAYHTQLKAAIQRQLISDVPVGILLSGGIDSALIAAMAKGCGTELPCFTVGFGGGQPECEINEANETAQALGLPFYSIETSPDQLWNALPLIVQSVEEPLGTTSVMPMWYLVNRARENVTVVLAGQGSDEPWGGYRRYQAEMVRRLFPFHSLWKLATKTANLIGNTPEIIERGLRTLSTIDLGERILEACALFSEKERYLLTGNNSDGNALQIINYWLNWLSGCTCQPTERMMRLDSRMNLADDLLLYGDKISMSAALEARVPMLDIELVGFIETLPLDFRIALRKTKIVHKKMAERYLPYSIVHREKKGFQVPFGPWSRGIWKDRIEKILFDNNAPHLTLLSREETKILWEQHLRGKPDRSRQLFALLMLAIWWKQQ
ncbi:MAG: asparagine synthase (glutamine-hydrolyzing) [Thermodesulfobacteriota bacterium]